MTSYTRGGCPLKQRFFKTSAMESKTFYGFLISYRVPTMVVVWVYPIFSLFLAKFHYIEFWVNSSSPKQFFLKSSAIESKTFCGFLSSNRVPTMVGVWVFQIVSVFYGKIALH